MYYMNFKFSHFPAVFGLKRLHYLFCQVSVCVNVLLLSLLFFARIFYFIGKKISTHIYLLYFVFITFCRIMLGFCLFRCFVVGMCECYFYIYKCLCVLSKVFFCCSFIAIFSLPLCRKLKTFRKFSKSFK